MHAYDVIVCGGGTAGAAAAIKAGRMGAKTLVIEQMNALGGTQAMGWVTPMMPNYLGGRQLVGGLNLDIQAEHARLSPETDFPNAQAWYNPVALALALDRLAEEAGVTRLYNAFLFGVRELATEGPALQTSSSEVPPPPAGRAKRSSGAEEEPGVQGGSKLPHSERHPEKQSEKPRKKIAAVRAFTKGGVLEFEAKVFIDATGDADLAFLAGAPTESGDAEGRNQPMTLRFAVANVDTARAAEFFGDAANPNRTDFLSVGFAEAKESPIGGLVKSSVKEGILEEDDLGYFQFFTMLGRPRELAFNCPRLSGFNPLDPFSLSEAQAAGREKIFRIHAFCKRFLPGFEESYVSVIAPLMGVRESRRIVGRYVLTEEDHQSCRKFEDAIARNRYPIDIHLASGGVELRKLPADDYHEIPYRSLLPLGVDNLLVAGRCLSATFVAQSSVRIQAVCRAMGEAAGAAAAICSREAILPPDLPHAKLKPHLDLSVG